jgi:hypothetical protein
MTYFKILTAAALAATAVAISPSIAQDRGGHAMGAARGGGAAPSAAATAAAPATAGRASVGGTASANFKGGTNMRTSQMNSAAPMAHSPGNNWQGHGWNGGNRNGGSWNGGRVADGNWNGRNGDWNRDRLRRGPGFAFGFGGSPGYYDDYAYNSYPYDDTYAYYNDPNYSDRFAYDTGPSVGVSVTSGVDDLAYCAQRFRSYDPASGTFLGYDGMRHPCP